jgi:hypothetical protein
MKNPSKTAANLAIGGALALLVASSAFADSSHQNETRRRERERSQPSAQQSERQGTRQADAQQSERQSARQADTQRQARPEVVERNRDSRSESGASNDSYRYNGDRNRSQSRDSRTEARREAARNDGYRNGNGNRNDSYRNNGNNRNDSRNRSNDNRGYSNRNNSRHEYREGARNSYRGTIRSYARERGGFRIFLSNGPYSYWVPESYIRGHQLRVGLSIRLGGIFRGGYISVDALGWPGYNDSYYNEPYYDDVYYDPGYNNDSYYGGYANDEVRGRVERVDFRNQTIVVQDDSNRGRYVTVDLRSVDRRNARLDIADLRPGDRVTMSGTWLRGNVFGASRIEAIDAY